MTDESRTTLRRLGAAALLMTVAMALSRVIGVLRESFIAARFGAGPHTDAFVDAFTIPDWLNYLVAGGTLSITLLPLYTKALVAGDEPRANRLLSTVTTSVTLLVLAGVLVGEIFAEPILGAFFERMPPDALAACVRYTRILLPAQLCFVLGGLLSTTLYARGKFAAAAFAPLFYSIGIIAGGWLLGGRLGPEALCWGALVGAFLGPFLVPAVAAVRAGAIVRPRLAVRDAEFIAWVKQSLPLMIGVSLITADDWILRYFATGDAGAVSHLNYAKRLALVPIAIVGQAVGQAAMPFFARLFAEGKRDELADTVGRTLRMTGVVAALVAGAMAALAGPIVTVLFQRGRFDAADAAATASYLAIFAAAIPLWSMQGLIARAFYAAGNTLVPMVSGTVVTVLSLPIYALAWNRFGTAGLAAASSVGILLHTVAIAALAPRVLPELRAQARGVIGAVARGALLAALAGAAAFFAARAVVDAMPGPALLAALVAGAVGGAAFVAVTLVGSGPLGVAEVAGLVRRIRQRLQRRR